MTMERVITGEQLKAARSRSGLSNKELAKLLGVSLSTLNNYLREGVVGRVEARVEDKLGLYLRDESAIRPLGRYSDVELLAELWQRMDEYKRHTLSGETEPNPSAAAGGAIPSEPTPGGQISGRIGEPPPRDRPITEE